jgi:hypothetical protein
MEVSMYAARALAAARIRLGQVGLAIPLLREADRLRREGSFAGDSTFWPDLIPGLAVACLDDETAARFIGFYPVYFASFGQLPLIDPWMERLIAGVRERLGVDAFEAACDLGASMTPEAAHAQAIGYLDQLEQSAPTGW